MDFVIWEKSIKKRILDAATKIGPDALKTASKKEVYSGEPIGEFTEKSR